VRYILGLSWLLVSVCLMGQNAKLYLKTAEQLMSNGSYQEAVEEYSRVLLQNPEQGEVVELRARANEQAGNYLEAADDYQLSARLQVNAAENYYHAGTLYFQLHYFDMAISMAQQASRQKNKYEEAYLLLSRASLERRDYETALTAASQALDLKNTAYANYLYGMAQYYLEEYALANESLEKAIIKDRNLLEAYLAQARVQLKTEKYRYALDNCAYVLLKEPNRMDALSLRSEAYDHLGDYGKAIADISKAIALDSTCNENFVLRGLYYQHNNQFLYAIDDFTHALSHDMLNPQTLEARAGTYEQMGLKKQAASDWSLLLSLADESNAHDYARMEQKIYELQRESEKPQIEISHPVLNGKQELLVSRDLQQVEIATHISDASKLRFLKMNSDTLVNDPKGVSWKDFTINMPAQGLEYLTVTATDVYDNTSTVSYMVEHIETKAPQLTLMDPYVGDDGIIHLNSDEHYLYLEGRVEDESLIRSIRIEESNASYAPADYNPRFTANLDVRNKNKLQIQATDVYGNHFQTEYRIVRSQQSERNDNPMGKTWVVLIENSEYMEFSNLSAPGTDMQLMQEALARYDIQKVIVKRNLTKREMERFFSIDLRDLIRVNQVNSLFIWFAGHGKNLNGTGYWIPADARIDNEFSYFNINALKASLYSYPSLKHILVVSDACETGPAFCEALRSPVESVSCQETNRAEKRSAQVLTSSGSGYAYDNSLFTQSFVNTLLNNDDDCVSIDAIAKRVQLTVGGNSAQKPEFGRISGIKDELGTFFFMTR